jgi:hypothetical protein
VDWINLADHKEHDYFWDGNESESGCINGSNFVEQVNDYQLLKDFTR